MPWLLNEAAALKQKVSGLVVRDASTPSGRPVEVRFREPENELADMKFPSIILEYSGISKASEREHRGPVYLGYIPEGMDPDNDGIVPTIDRVSHLEVPWDTTAAEWDPSLSPFYVRDYPVPYNVDFKVTVYSRFQTELMPLMNDLAKIDRLPHRFGYLEISQDRTVRTMDVVGGPEIVAERDPQDKRVFRAVYSVRVASELNMYDVMQITTRINTVDIDLQSYPAVGD